MEPRPIEAAALHADDIHPVEMRDVAIGKTEGNHVPAHAAHAADHRAFTHARELMNSAQAAQKYEIADFAVAAERCTLCEGDVVSDDTIVCDMTAAHQKAAVPHGCFPSRARTDVHRDVLANVTV